MDCSALVKADIEQPVLCSDETHSGLNVETSKVWYQLYTCRGH